MNRSALLCCAVLLLLASSATSPAGAEPVNMLSLQEGTLPVVVPPTYGGWDAERLLDDSPRSGWACESGHPKDNIFVFELAEKTVLDRFEFDNSSVDTAGSSAKDVVVEVSATSADSGYTQVLAATLADRTDGQNFPAARKLPGRWIRLTIRNNYGSGEYTELFSFRGFGEKPTGTPPGDVSGSYDSSYSTFHIRQQGTALAGCYEHDEGLLNGTIEGRVMKLTWQEGGGPDDNGPAVMVFSPDGSSFRGFWWAKGGADGPPNGAWDGRKVSAKVGSCPHWSGSVSGELKKKLSGEKRARLYGILFDFNSATIRPESKPVLEEVLALLEGEPAWKITIEGHTDAVGGDARNLTLSRQRAESVKGYLVAAGIEASRLNTVGFGEARPVADNATELGRAQNRRVELVRE